MAICLGEGLQDNVGFGWGFGIPAIVMIIAVVIFMVGSKIYRFKPPGGSPLATIAQVVIAAARKRHHGPISETLLYAGPVYGRHGPIEKICHTEQFRQVPLHILWADTHRCQVTNRKKERKTTRNNWQYWAFCWVKGVVVARLVCYIWLDISVFFWGHEGVLLLLLPKIVTQLSWPSSASRGEFGRWEYSSCCAYEPMEIVLYFSSGGS